MRLTTFSLALLFAFPAAAQHLIPQPTFDAIANEYSGEAAQELDRQIVQYHRIQGSPMMAAVAKEVALPKLQAWGIESSIEQFPSDGKTRYQTYVSPMGWDMRGGELWVEGVGNDSKFVPFRVCRYSDVPMCVSTYSKGGDWAGELVEVGAGTSEKDYEGADRDVRGKVALAYGYAANVVREAAIKHGAIGVVIYPAPGDRPDHPDMVRYNGIWPTAEELDKTVGGFQISANQYTELRGLMQRGPVRVHGKIDATLGLGQLTVVHAWIRGTKNPEMEVLITGHLDHPKWSANDNASGSAAMLEMARTLHTLIASGKLAAPAMTIHFMWVPEYFGTFAYVTKHPEARACAPFGWDDPRQNKPYRAGEPCIYVNLNLDMVGEDTVKTNSRFYITRTPDSIGGFLNGILADVLKQTREADLYAGAGTRNYWPAEMIPYVQGSDHDIFVGMGIQAAMLGHDPDWTHHTSEDTPDKTDATEFRRVGVLAGAAAYWMAIGRGENSDFLRDAYVGIADIVSDRTHRVAEILAGPNSPGAQRRLSDNLKTIDIMRERQERFTANFLDQVASVASESKKGAPETSASIPKGPALRRLVLLPLAATLSDSLSGDDAKWWNEQAAQFAAGPGDGLAVGPTFDVIVFETINFMDGKRTAADIAQLLAVEFNRDFDAAWVERLAGLLERMKVVAAN
jgi:aminopeptidase YwaD